MWREQWDSTIKFMRELYERYLYLILKPLLILLFLVLLFKLIYFVGENVVDFILLVSKLTLPFLLGIVISFMLEPVNQFLEKKLKFPRVVAVSSTLLTTLLVIFGSIALLLYVAIMQLVNFSNDIIRFISTKDKTYFENLVNNLLNFLSDNLSFISYFTKPEDMANYSKSIQDNLTSISDNALHFLSITGKSLAVFASNFFINIIPTLLVVGLIAIITSFFVSKDKKQMLQVMEDLIPQSIYDAIFKIKTEAIKNFLKYMRGQLILVSISALFFLIAFLIIRSPYAIALALLVLVLDLIPVVGTFVLVIPWAIYAFANGDMFTVYILIGTYLISSVVRQIIEPKIMADSLGFHPLLLLIAFYLGVQFFGSAGVILGPVFLILIKILFDTGIIKWKKYEKKE